MALNVRGRKPRPDPEALYEAKSSYAVGARVFQAGGKLSGSHPEVRARFGQWMMATLPDDEKGRLRAESDWGEIVAEGPHTGPAPDPIAEPPSGKFRAIRSFRLADPDLQHVARVSVGDLVDADDPMPAPWAAATSDMTPDTVRTAPSSASSPSSAVFPSRLVSGSWPDAARMPTAMATSYAVPSFGRSAEANLR